MKYCGCCMLEVEERQWDGLYGVCSDCAFCASLEHFPCCHKHCCSDTQPDLDMFTSVDRVADPMPAEMTWEELVQAIRRLPPPTEEQRREHAASFAYGQMALMSRYANASSEELEAQMCRRMAGCT